MSKGATIASLILVLLKSSLWPASLTATPRNISGHEPQSEVTFDAYTGESSYLLAQQYVELTCSATASILIWKVDIYTDNNDAMTGYQKAGLLSVSTVTARLPLAWAVASTAATPVPGDPSTHGTGWLWLKDKNDEDDPETTNDESWQGASGGGYTTVVYDNSGNNSVSSGAKSKYYVYLEGIAPGTTPGTYQGTIWFDFYAVPDRDAPTIKHEPVGLVAGHGNKIVCTAEANDNNDIQWIKIHYKTDSSTWQVCAMDTTGSRWTKQAKFVFLPRMIKDVSKIYYALEASDGNQSVWWHSLDEPHTFDIVDAMTFNDTLEGDCVLPDGNPDDGNNCVHIPAGSLQGPTRITVAFLESAAVPKNTLTGEHPLSAYEFSPDACLFKKPIEVMFLYYDLDEDGLIESAEGVEQSISAEDLVICWWDGFEWRPLGTSHDTVNKTVKAMTNHFCYYALFPRQALTADSHRPREKIITPLAPGMNDAAFFDNFLAGDYQIRIFDINGRRVRTIESPQLPQWNGKDENNNFVESGVYLYQFEVDVNGSKELVSGTIIVAK